MRKRKSLRGHLSDQKDLDLHFLECFTHFCSDTVEGIDFPQLQILRFWELPEFQNFWPIDNNSIADSNPLFDEKVSCPNQSMEEVIKEEELVEERTIKPLFPQLEKLVLEELPKLGHFFLTKHALEFPFLGEVKINSCPEMKTFSLGSEQEACDGNEAEATDGKS
ncbi:hypothetical protein KY284_013064 [Solanum tuberosum]|nr:hypothetical protein KY284_013064 [Solanum tuberosum]